MRKYTLASSNARQEVDLRDYKDVITEAVIAVMPAAIVRVERDCYYVSPMPTQSQAIKIGRHICQSKLKHNCVQIPKLFTSIEVKEVNVNDEAKQQQEHTGGHR